MNNVEIGAQYSTKQALREVVTKWALTTQRIFQTDVSNKQYVTMTCVEEGCPARVHGHVPKYDINWVVTSVVGHTCVLKNMRQDHPNLTSTLIARLLFNEIIKKKDMEVKGVQTAVKERWNYDIPYGKAWRAKQRALENRFGTFFDSYDNVVRVLHTLKERNPGTYVNVQHFTKDTIPGYKILQRVFFSFNICIEAFRYCRPVLCVDARSSQASTRGRYLLQ